VRFTECGRDIGGSLVFIVMNWSVAGIEGISEVMGCPVS